MKRLILLCLLLLPACEACVSPDRTPLADENGPAVAIDTATQQFLRMLSERMVGHTTLPNREAVLCVYGTVTRDTIFVTHFRATRNTATDSTVSFNRCHASPDYLGTLHTHPAGPYGDGCWLSNTDITGFLGREDDIIALVTCSKGIVVRVKKNYYERIR